MGRRIKKAVTPNSELLTQNYIYDGDQIIAEYDGAVSLAKKYIYGPGIDQPVCVIARSGSDEAIHYYHYDGLGSVTDLTDSTGAVVETYSYDAFGQPTIKDVSGLTLQVSSVGNRFMFTAREYDSETELYYYRARYYNTNTGRFLQRDPLGYIDGPNPYTYCLNAPINWVDPLGLCTEKKDDSNWWEDNFNEALNQIEDFSNALMMNPFADLMPQIPLDQGLGVLGIGVVKGTRIVGEKAIVIGETMERVIKKARNIGAEWYKPKTFIGNTAEGLRKAMTNNYQWLRNKVQQGYKVIDAGIDNRREIRSIFYKAEKRWLKLWGK